MSTSSLIDFKSNKNVYSALETAARHFGEKPFAFFSRDKNQLSYTQLFEGAEGYASFLASQQINFGSRATVYFEKSREFLCVYFALLKLGVTIHTIDINSNLKDELAAVTLLKSNVFLTNQKTLKRASSELKPILGLIRDVPEYDQIENGDFIPVPTAILESSHTAVCVFTSGTTGIPKGIVSSHGNLLAAANFVRLSHEIIESDIAVNIIPMSSINGQVTTILGPLTVGSSVVFYQDMFSTFGILSCIEKYRATWFSGIPTHYSIMVRIQANPSDFDLSALKFVRSASAPLPVSILKAFEEHYRIPIINTLGLSEMTGQVFSNPRNSVNRKINSVGRPIGNQAKIVDSEGNQLGPGEEGELIVTGDNLMLGYCDDPDSTRIAVRNGWLYTGDIAYYDRDNFFYIVGRKKDIVIVGGQNVSLKEVDDIVYGCPDVIKTASIGATETNSPHGETIISFVVKKRLSDLTEDKIRKHCAKSLSKHKIPRKVFFVDSLPEGGTGKILRSRVKQLYEQLGIP